MSARRERHRVPGACRCPRSSPSPCRSGRGSGGGDVDGPGAPRRPRAVGAGRRPGHTIGVGRHPAGRPVASNWTRRWPRSASVAGRCRTSCCRSASARSPPRCGDSGRTAAVNVTVHAAGHRSSASSTSTSLLCRPRSTRRRGRTWRCSPWRPPTVRSPATPAAVDRRSPAFARVHVYRAVRRLVTGRCCCSCSPRRATDRASRGRRPAFLGDLVDVGYVDGELEQHSVGILGVQRAAIAVLEHVRAVRLPVWPP